MPLGRVDEERMTQIDRTRLSYCQDLRPIGAHLLEVHVRHARLAGGLEESCHVHVRANPYPRWSVVGTDIREEKQHQQRTTARGDVHAPR
jgi:hypothetical protein